MTNVGDAQIALMLDKVLAWSRARDYRGYNKHDGLNSPLLRLLLGWSKWSRIIAIQGVMRFPVNLRPLLLVKKTLNPKGLALFTQAWLHRYQVSGQPAALEQARSLLTTLLQQRATGDWQGLCWGYDYPWQDPGFYAPPRTPNAVVTSFVCEAFLHAYRVTGDSRYLDTVGKTIPFYFRHLKRLKDTDTELCLSYMPVPMQMRVMDVSILIAAVIAQYSSLAGDSRWLEQAHRLAAYVANRQTDYGAWYYTDPREDSLIRHDNYHTGFILDAFQRYSEACNTDCPADYSKGLRFYAEQLFNPDGSPRWMSDKDFPHDIHGAAQGILTFSRHLDRYQDLVTQILEWTGKRMWHHSGRFYYQQTRCYRKRFTLMRWCNAWMARALAACLYHRHACRHPDSDTHAAGNTGTLGHKVL